ncbi:MAG: XdhC family protein [Chloroflexi bacterium]|nr:XdhC family protein [Chloroflexota bacterium]
MPRPEKITGEFLEAVERGEEVALATVVSSPGPPLPAVGERVVVWSHGRRLASAGLGGWEETLAEAGQHALAERRSGTVTYTSEANEPLVAFLEVVEPAPTVVVIGAGHVGQAVARLAKMFDFRVVVVDDRPDFASRERFPTADQVIAGEFLAALRSLPIGPTTYVVLVTRGHRHDEVCLRQAAVSPAAYVGMIGSRRRVRIVLQHLAEDGVPAEALARVHSPIGLDIGAETPEEIALSIMAEIVKEKRGGTGESMKLASPKGAEA